RSARCIRASAASTPTARSRASPAAASRRAPPSGRCCGISRPRSGSSTPYGAFRRHPRAIRKTDLANRRLADPHLQPKEFAFTAENRAWADKVIARYPEGRQASAVIPLLWRAQEQAGGWLPQKAIEHVAEILSMARIRVLEVATFYTMFLLSPVG